MTNLINKILNKSIISKIKIKDEINGSGTTKIGKYGIAYYKKELQDIDIIEFYNNHVKDNKEEGYIFPGADNWFEFGQIDKYGMLNKTYKFGTIKKDKIEYR